MYWIFLATTLINGHPERLGPVSNFHSVASCEEHAEMVQQIYPAAANAVLTCIAIDPSQSHILRVVKGQWQ